MKLPGFLSGATPSPQSPADNKKGPQKRSRRRLVWLGLLLLLFLAAVAQVRRIRSGEEQHPQVTVAKADLGDVRTTVSATGTLQPFTQIDVKSKAGGKVIKMVVEEGTVVKAGQLLALIDPEDTRAAYRNAMADQSGAASSVQQSKENLRLQEAQLGPQVRQASQGVTSARAKLRQAQENLHLQTATLGPQISQAAQGVITARARLQQAREGLVLQTQTSQSDVKTATQAVAAAGAKLDQARQQAASQPELTRTAIAGAQADVDSSQAGLRSAQESLKLLTGATQPQALAAAQAAVRQVRSDVATNTTNLGRLQALLAKGFVPASQVDTAQNVLTASQSQLETAQARLDTLSDQQGAELRDQQAKVEAAQGSVSRAQAALASAQANAMQNSLKQSDVQAAQAAYKQAQLALISAHANLGQIEVKRSDVAAAISAVSQSESGLRAAQANSLQVDVKQADIETSMAAVRQAQDALQVAQANSIQSGSKYEDVQQARSKLTRAEVTAQNARINLKETTVVAPMSGIVTKKYVDVGTIIQSGLSGFSAGSPIVQISDTNRVYVDTQVDEADIAAIEAGQEVSISLDAYPNSPKGGKVRKVYPQATVDQNVTYIHVQVEINSEDVDERLRGGMNATCEFLTDEKRNVLTVPSEAIKDVGDETQVTVIKDPKKPAWDEANQEKRIVEVGLRGDDLTEIVKGLKKGETVVTQIILPVATPAAGAAGAGAGGGAPRGPTGGGKGGGGGGRRGG